MKNLIILTLSLSVFLININAQEIVEFKNEFLSETEYIQETISTNHIDLEFFGSEDFLHHLESKNIENPQTIIDTSYMKIAYRTGKSKNNVFPIEIEYINAGQNEILKNGDKVFGTYGKNTSLKLNDLSNKNLGEDDKKQFLNTLEYGFSTELFEGKKMNIGDTLFTTSPMIFPIAGTQLELIIESTYKLTKVDRGIAHFDITQSCKANSVHPEITLTASGKGKGYCTYSIKERRILLNSTSLTLKMLAKMTNGVEIKINQTSSFDSSTVVN